MGDSKRFKVVSEFIIRNYPKAQRILCVADGKGDLCKLLKDRGKDAHVIDPVYNGIWFNRDIDIACDLIVGLHPDEATGEIVIAGEKLKIPYLIVPCCLKGVESKGIKGFPGWIKHLKNLSGDTLKEVSLPIKGMNLLLFKTKF